MTVGNTIKTYSESAQSKTVIAFYLLLACFFSFDVMNMSLLWSPKYFSFVPIFLFIISIKIPAFLPIVLFLFIGFLTDVLSYGPIGLMALFYSLVVLWGRWQYRFILAQTFRMVWLIFTAYWGAFLLGVWALCMLYFRQNFSVVPVMYDWLYGVMCFPVLWGAAEWFEKTTPTTSGELE